MTPTIEDIDINLNLSAEEVYATLASFELPENVGRFNRDNLLQYEEEVALSFGKRSLIARQFAKQEGDDFEISNFVRAIVLLSHLPEKSMIIGINQKAAEKLQLIEVHQRDEERVMHYTSDHGVHYFINIKNENTLLATFQKYLDLPTDVPPLEFSMDLNDLKAIKNAKGNELDSVAEELLAKTNNLPPDMYKDVIYSLTQPEIAISIALVEQAEGENDPKMIVCLKSNLTIMMDIRESEKIAMISTIDTVGLSDFIKNAGF